MILSTSHGVTLALLTLAMLCAGLWPNTLKMISRWRFELYYLDFAWGFLLVAAVAAFTLGSFNSGELTFQDNLAIAGYRKMAFCLAAGFTFGLGGYLLCAAIALAGMSVAFVISLGLSGVIAMAAALASGLRSGVVLLSVGVAAVLTAVIVAAYAHSARADTIQAALQNTPLRPDPRDPKSKKPNPPPAAGRGIVIGILSGIFLGLSPLVVEMGRMGEDGVAAYGVALLFALGLLGSVIFFSPFFWNFPAMGRSLRMRDYWKGSMRNHALGLLGGVLGGVAMVAAFVAHAATGAAQPAAPLGYALGRGEAIIAALTGLLAWNEFHEAEGKTSLVFAMSVVAFAIGIGLAAFAQL